MCVDKTEEAKKRYRESHREELNIKSTEYYEAHKEKRRAESREWQRKKMRAEKLEIFREIKALFDGWEITTTYADTKTAEEKEQEEKYREELEAIALCNYSNEQAKRLIFRKIKDMFGKEQ